MCIRDSIYDDVIFQIGKDKFSKTYKFSDINYAVASREDKEDVYKRQLLMKLKSPRSLRSLRSKSSMSMFTAISS